jgi:hypothetical protein
LPWQGLVKRCGGEHHWAFTHPNFGLGVCGASPEPSWALE